MSVSQALDGYLHDLFCLNIATPHLHTVLAGCAGSSEPQWLKQNKEATVGEEIEGGDTVDQC